MSGVSDAPFRAAVRSYGTGRVVSEMVASAAMVETMRDTRKLRAVFDPKHPTILQLAGYDPDLLARAVEIACARGAQAIDLNFGCPARRVVGRAAGSALMRDGDLCGRIFRAVGRVASVPWSVKMRLGWDHHHLNAPSLAQMAAGEGASLITVHGRTRCQFYKGDADWRAVRAVGGAISIPLIVNGDIANHKDVATALRQSGAHGYMVGRAAIGRPWLLKALEAARSGTPWNPSWAEQKQAHVHLLEAMLRFHGTDLGLKSYRKHLSAWLSNTSNTVAGDQRRALLTTQTPASIFRFLDGEACQMRAA